jgi:putative N-acetylmannosamine-6-phosphate epimerase
VGTLRDAILAADDLPREQVQTDEWAPSGVPFVFVRGLTAAERDNWESSVTVLAPDGSRRPNPRLKNSRARFAALVMVDENGARIFEDADVDRLAERSAAVLERIALVGLRLSGMIEADANPSTDDPDV